MKLSDFPKHVQDKIRADNPDAFRPVQAKIPQPDQGGKGQNPELEKGAARLAYRVSLIVLSRRAMDSHDNLPFSVKPLADAITESLGLDDDSEITWEYGQQKTEGEQGVLVKIEAA